MKRLAYNSFNLAALALFTWLAVYSYQQRFEHVQVEPVPVSNADRMGKEAVIVQALFIEPYEMEAGDAQ